MDHSCLHSLHRLHGLTQRAPHGTVITPTSCCHLQVAEGWGADFPVAEATANSEFPPAVVDYVFGWRAAGYANSCWLHAQRCFHVSWASCNPIHIIGCAPCQSSWLHTLGASSCGKLHPNLPQKGVILVSLRGSHWSNVSCSSWPIGWPRQWWIGCTYRSYM